MAHFSMTLPSLGENVPKTTMNFQGTIAVLLQFGEVDLVRKLAKFFGSTATKQEEYGLVSSVFLHLGDYKDAIEFGEKAISDGDEKFEFMMSQNLYHAYRAEFCFDKALDIIKKIVEMIPDNYDAKIEYAFCLYDAGKKNESLEVLYSIKENELNDYQRLKYYAACGPHQLRTGDFQNGIKNVIMAQDQIRKIQYNHQYHGATELPLTFWQGTPDCKKLIVYLEAGLGDEVINLRFLKNLKDIGIEAKLYSIWYEDPQKNNREGIIEFYEKNGFEFIRHFDPEKHKDYQWTYSQYLPILLNLKQNDLWKGPYLKAKKKKLKGKKKIGLRWSGNLIPKHRNFPLKLVYNTLKDLDANFYSIQKHVCMEELEEFPEITNLADKLHSLEDMADYINSFDLLITCPTVSCAIAGALDKPCVVLTPCSDYYVFNTLNDHTPWFSKKMTLVRQKTPKEWADVMSDLRKIVKEKLAT